MLQRTPSYLLKPCGNANRNTTLAAQANAAHAAACRAAGESVHFAAEATALIARQVKETPNE